MTLSQETIVEALSKVEYEAGSNIVAADLIATIALDKETIKVIFKPSQMPVERQETLSRAIKEKLLELPEVKQVQVDYPPQSAASPNRQSPQRSLYFDNYRRVILIASGKGGVGKSTCALNIALALKKLGQKVALFDADVYGPSIPLMMGVRGHSPYMKDNKLQPMSRFGLEFISTGSIIQEGDAVAWRGPMVHQVIDQLMRDTAFSGGDYMIIDLPPGTGDVQLTLAQLTAPYGAVIVCTPQDVALIDARRAMAMLQKVNIPILGVVENMSEFVCPACGHKSRLFGHGGAEKESAAFNTEFLGRLPIDIDIRTGSDEGRPLVHEKPGSLAAKMFVEIANKISNLK